MATAAKLVDMEGRVPAVATRETRDDLSEFGLSPREFEVARLISTGLSNKEIAQFLDISHHTVSAHLRRVFDKLRINRRSKLAAYVAERLAQGRDGFDLR